MFIIYKYLIVNSHLVFWSGNFFLVAPFPDHCLLVPFTYFVMQLFEKVQVGKDQEKAQSEKDSHSKNRDGKKVK